MDGTHEARKYRVKIMKELKREEMLGYFSTERRKSFKNLELLRGIDTRQYPT